jgi:ribosomal protein L37AE/L43A
MNPKCCESGSLHIRQNYNLWAMNAGNGSTYMVRFCPFCGEKLGSRTEAEVWKERAIKAETNLKAIADAVKGCTP